MGSIIGNDGFLDCAPLERIKYVLLDVLQKWHHTIVRSRHLTHTHTHTHTHTMNNLHITIQTLFQSYWGAHQYLFPLITTERNV